MIISEKLIKCTKNIKKLIKKVVSLLLFTAMQRNK